MLYCIEVLFLVVLKFEFAKLFLCYND